MAVMSSLATTSTFGCTGLEPVQLARPLVMMMPTATIMMLVFALVTSALKHWTRTRLDCDIQLALFDRATSLSPGGKDLGGVVVVI